MPKPDHFSQPEMLECVEMEFIFIGDSITKGAYRGAGGGWSSVLQGRLAESWLGRPWKTQVDCARIGV